MSVPKIVIDTNVLVAGLRSRRGSAFRLLTEDTRQIMAVLPKRVAHFDLTIHPTKTVLVSFRKPASRQETDTGNGTFELLGLTHDWARPRRGYWVIKRKPAGKRLRRAQKSLWQ